MSRDSLVGTTLAGYAIHAVVGEGGTEADSVTVVTGALGVGELLGVCVTVWVTVASVGPASGELALHAVSESAAITAAAAPAVDRRGGALVSRATFRCCAGSPKSRASP